MVLHASDGVQQWNPEADWETVRKHAIAKVAHKNLTKTDKPRIVLSGDVAVKELQFGQFLDEHILEQRKRLLAAEVVGNVQNPIASLKQQYPQNRCYQVINTSALTSLLFVMTDYAKHPDVSRIERMAEDKLNTYYKLLEKRKNCFAGEYIQQFLNEHANQQAIDTSQWPSLQILDSRTWNKINQVYQMPIDLNTDHVAVDTNLISNDEMGDNT